MNTRVDAKRLTAVFLSVFLLGLLASMLWRGVGDLRTQITLGVGALLGAVYGALGKLPDWMTDYSRGQKLTQDDDPANISPRVYLSILGLVLLIASAVSAYFLVTM